MSDKLKGKVAIVTGSGQGIGRGIALALGKEGAKVITNNRKPGTPGGDAESTAREIRDLGGKAMPFFGDVSKFEIGEKIVQAAVDNFGRLDILVNNGGFDMPHIIWNMTEEDWDICLDSYLKGAFNCTRFAAAIMKQQRWGRILNTSSNAWLGTTGHSNYGAAKAGLVGFSRSIARELGRFGITCNAFTPHAATRFTLDDTVRAGYKRRYELGLMSKEDLDKRLNQPPPETMGPFIAYLCTDEAGDINGQVLDVDWNKVSLWSEPVKVSTISKDKAKGDWTVEELIELVPKKLLVGYENPAPVQPL
ncbi:MAG: SDR family oxidoreductase [Chloroflexi bacterium]|nr:SDR family oxidoreductase [Chloroflexota bacterium]